MNRLRLARAARGIFDRAVRIGLSAVMLGAYFNVNVASVAPTEALASPASLSVTATVSNRPLLGGTATVHVTVKNTDTTDKAYNISLGNVFSSSRSPQGVVKFVSASDGNGTLVPTSVNTTAATGQTGVSFFNVRDLAPQETWSADVVVDMSADASWTAGDLLYDAVTVGGDTIPNQTIPDITATTVASAKVLPIIIKSKTAQQSTGVEQATGTGAARQYTYTIDVQNNYVGPSQSVVVTDTVPDGIEYLGMHGGSSPNPAVSRDASTGVTTLVWTLGTMAQSASKQLVYDVGIRYDYFGTNNGGKNRADGSALTTATAGQPILTSAGVKKTFVNNATLGAQWLSSPATDTANASVTGAALTIAKSADKTSGGLGTRIGYTLTYATSQYFSALATGAMTPVHDHIPDGQIFEESSASPAPSAVTTNTDGSTDVTWTVGAVSNTSSGQIKFSTLVGTNWQEPSYAGDPIVSGDSMVNHADISGVASDNVNAARPNLDTSSTASVGFSTHLPGITKEMLDPTTHLWSKNVTMTVGDTSTVRVRFNTTDGMSPEHSDINMGNIALADWLPVGMTIIPGTFNVHYSNASDFTLPTTGTPPPLNISTPTTISIGGLQGASWYLGNVAPAGWWEATFDVRIGNVPAVQDGVIVANLWKLTGVNTFGTPYSARDLAMCDYAGPHLVLTKSATPPTPLAGGSAVPYTLSISNTSSGTAYQGAVTDTLPVGERATAPTVDTVKLDGTTLAEGTDYATSWNAATGELKVNLEQGAIQTPIEGGSVLQIKYTATVDPGVVAGSSLTNTATVAYSTRTTADGRVTSGTIDPADDNTDISTVHVSGLKIAKAGPNSPFTIGQTFGYDVDVTVPAHAVAHWPSVTDLMTHEGLVPTGTPTITTLSTATPLVPASFVATASTPATSSPTSGQLKLRFDFADAIDNTNCDVPYVFRLHFDVTYTGVKSDATWEFQPPLTHDSFTDTATVAWNSVASAIRQTDSSVVSTQVTTGLQQPLLKTVKTITSVGPYAGGSTIDYQVAISNVGSSTAFNPTIADTLPTGATDATIASLSLPGSAITSASVTSFVATPTMRIGFDPSISISTTQTLTVKYRVTLPVTLGAGVAITNTADVNWNSLPGAPGGSRVYNDGGQENWTQDTQSKTTNAALANIVKRGPAGPVRLGDIVTYSIDATVPANTVAWYPVFVDSLSQRGLSYVSNSATITTRANAPAVPADLGGASTPASATSAPSTTTLTWSLPSAIDNSGNNHDYGFTLSFQVQVTGNNLGAWEYWPASAGQQLTDSASFKWRDVSTGGPATNHTAVSLNTATAVTQPLITTQKFYNSPGPLSGGSAFDYKVVLTNSGYNTAYDVSVNDTMPAEIASADLATATEAGVGDILGSATTDFSHLPTNTVSFSSGVSMSTTQTITLIYHCTLSPTVGSGATLTNSADTNWSSLPGAIPGERVYADSAQEGPTWTADTTSVSTQTPLVTLGKRLPSGFTTATIGTSFPYTIEATIPANTTAFAMQLSDLVPPSLTVVAALPSVGLPAAVVASATAAGTQVSVGPTDWPPAPVSTPSTVALTLLCQVRDKSYTGAQVPSGVISNTASVGWNTRASGGSPLSATTPAVNFTVVQPTLTITKAASPGSAGPADTVTFTSVLTNTGNSAAFAPSWSDVLPATMANPQLLSVKESALPTLTAGTDFSTTTAGNTLSLALDQPSSPSLAPGESLTVKFTGSVVGGVHNGASLVDTATITSYSSLPTTTPPARTYGPASTTAAVTALSPALTITKTVLSDAYPLQGTRTLYRLVIKNVGTAPALGVVATDTLPADLTYVPGSTSAMWPSAGASNTADPNGGTGPTLNWNFGGSGATLAAGDSLTLVFKADIDPAAPIGSRVNTATTAATDASGAPVPANAAAWIVADNDPTDSATAPIRVVKPGVAVAKILATGGDQYVQVNQLTGFKLTVTNTGDTTLTTVPLTDTYNPAELRYSSASVGADSSGGGTVKWNNFGPIAPFSSRSVNVTFTVQAQPASGVATNYASVANVVDEFAHALASTQDTATVFVTHPAVAVTKALHAGQDTTIQAGQTAVYDVVVTNTGDTTLTTVPLSDTFVAADLAFTTATVAPSSSTSGSVTWNNLGALAPGDSTTVTATFTAQAAPAALTSADTARVNGALDIHGDSPSNASASASIAITKPLVSVTKTLVSDAQIQVGQTATFKLNVTNTGDTTLTSIPVSDSWDGLALTSPSASPAGLYGSNSATWTLSGALAPGASTVVTLTLTALSVPSGQVTTDTATVGTGTDLWGDPAPGNSSSASVRITHPSLSVTKTLHAGQDPVVQVGQPVAYDLTLTNDGDTTLTTVPLTDTYDPAALTYVSASLGASGVAGGVVTWNNTGALSPGANRTITATFTARAVPTGQVSADTAAVTAATDQYGDHPVDSSATASVRITRPAIQVVKVRSAGQDPQIQAGQTAKFDLGVTNTGDTTLATTTLTDTWDPAVFGYSAASPSASSAGSGTASWTLTSLAPGTTTTITVTLLASGSPASLTTTDTASAIATDAYGDPAGPSASSATIQVTHPAIAVLKTLSVGQDPQVQAGQTVRFDLRVTNSGNTTLTTVPLSDVFDSSALTYTTATVAPTSAGGGVLAWSTIGALGSGATKVVTVTFTAASVPPGQVTLDSLASTGCIDVYGDPAADATATGSVRITAPAVAVTKTLHAGQDPAVQAGQGVAFDLVVTNTGDTTLTTVPLTDTYDAARLHYASASPSADTSAAGTAHWDDLGTLAPGASTTVTAHFSAVSNPPGQVTTDTVTVPGATDLYGDHPSHATATAGVKVTAPSYTLTKTRVTDAAIQSSQTVTFDLTVHNTGDTTLTSVPLSDTWDPAYLAYFSATQPPATLSLGFANWNIAPIAPGGSATVEVTLIALQPVPGLTTADVAAVSGATDENGDTAVDQGASATVDITHPQLSITKTLVAGQDTHVQVGEAIAYDVAVTNTGDTTLTTVPLADTYDAAHLRFASASPSADATAAGSLAWDNLGPLVPGQTTTVTVHFTATATGTAIVNSAETHGTDVNGDPAPSVSASDTTLRITAPAITLTKTLRFGQDPQIRPGQTATYDISLANSGDTTLTAAEIVDEWDPAVFTLATSTPAPYFSEGGAALWVQDLALAPGDSTTVTITLTAISTPPELHSPDQAGALAVDEFGDETGIAWSDADILVTQPAVHVTKQLHPGQDPVVQAGQDVAYDIGVTNTGDTTLTTVPLSDTYDSGALSPVSATPSAADYANDGTLDWANVGPLAPGETTTVTVHFTAVAVPSGQVTTDTATVSGASDLYGDPADEDSANASVRITHPAVSVKKIAHSGQDPAIQAGQSATFDIGVTNTGDTTLTTVPLSDTYDASVLAFAGATTSPDSTSPAGTLTWNDLGTLDPGQTTTVTVTFTAAHAAPGQVTVDAAAVARATDQYGDHPADASDTASVKVTQPSLTLSKTLAPNQDLFIQTGQTVTFHLAVTNSGDTTLTTVELHDLWDGDHLAYVSSTVPPDSAGGGIAHWTLYNIAPGATAQVDQTLVALSPVPGHVTTDTAVATRGIDENGDPANDDTSQAAISVTKPMVAITKTPHPGQDAEIQEGQHVVYDIVVTNIGDVRLASVPVYDSFDPLVFEPVISTPSFSFSTIGLADWNNVGPLDPGESATITATFAAVGASGGTASVDTATVVGARDVNGDLAPNVSAEAAQLVTRPAVRLAKHLAEGQPTTVRLGSVVAWDVTAVNTGDTTLTTVPLTDSFDSSQFAYVSAIASPTLVTSGALTWSNVAAVPLGPGQATTTRVNLMAISAGNHLTNSADISTATDVFGDPTRSAHAEDYSLSVYDPASLLVTKTAEPVAGTILLPSQLVTYTIAWTNAGGVSMPGVIASDPLPTSVNFVPGTVKLNGSPVADSASYDASSRTVRVSLGDVGAETTGAVTFQVRVAAESLSAMGVRNTAYFVSQESTVATAGPVYHPVDPITITKVGRDVNGGSLKGGDVIEWTITVTNIGLTPTTHVILHDTVPNTTVYVRGSIRGKGGNDSKVPALTWDIGTMAVGEVQVATFRSAVKKGLPTGTLIRNQAIVSSDQSRPKKSDNPQTATKGDATILVARTSGSEDWRFPLGGGIMLLVAGMWLWPRRRKLVPIPAEDPDSDLKGGGRNA